MHVAQRVILIVDGRTESRALYRTMLEDRGYTVVEADDGAGGLRLAEVVKPDLVLAQVGGEAEENLVFVRTLREDDRLNDVQVVGIAEGGAATAAKRALEAGCMRCFDEALEPMLLLTVVDELIGAPPDEPDGKE